MSFASNNIVKNRIEDEYEVPQDIELLNKWTIPKINPRTVYRYGFFDNMRITQVVQTTEETISLNKEDMEIKLLNSKSLEFYKKTHRFLHIGLVQIAFKPLTLEGLPESFIAALRDARNLDYNSSLMGIIQSSLAHGPVYFNVYPNLQLSLSDINIYDALTLNVKTHGYNYTAGSEVICICSRIYYKPLHTLNPRCRIKDKSINETVLIETNFKRSEITTRRSIKWEEIEFPKNWIINNAIPRIPQTQSKPLSITQTPDGQVKIEFDDHRRSSDSICSRSDKENYFYIAPNYKVDYPESSRASTSRIRETGVKEDKVEGIKIKEDNIARGIYTVGPDATVSEFGFSD